MGLAAGVKGARHTSQTITWTDSSGNAQDLTGATITGVLRDLRTGISRAIDGDLAISDASNGVFTWAYGANDVQSEGLFEVQFKATYTDTKNDATFKTTWEVKELLEVA